jgi:hypothetical protein
MTDGDSERKQGEKETPEIGLVLKRLSPEIKQRDQFCEEEGMQGK